VEGLAFAQQARVQLLTGVGLEAGGQILGREVAEQHRDAVGEEQGEDAQGDHEQGVRARGPQDLLGGAPDQHLRPRVD
jgi:hypothetical protein